MYKRQVPAYAAYGCTLCLGRGDATDLPELLGPAGLARITARYAALFPGADRLSVLSLWSQYYLLALLPPAAAAALVLGQDLPVALDGMAARLAESGQPTRLCLPHPGQASTAAGPAARLTPLLRMHLEPLAARLAQAGLPPRVLWSNVGSVLAWTLGVIAAAPGEAEAVAAAATCPRWVDGGPNPLCPVLARGEGCALHRRICCLRYRLAGMAECPDCPRNCRLGHR